MPSTVHLFISGRVQGVYFRQSTQQQAEALGLAGFVRNLPDGRVEVYITGEEEAVQKGLDFLRTGPPGTQVDSVEPFASSMDSAEVPQRGFLILPTPGQAAR